MPNWCNNWIRLEHDDLEMVDRAGKALAEGRFLQEFIPCPDELQAENAECYAQGDEGERLNAIRAANVEKYGYQSWYDWRLANWGCKWDIEGSAVSSPEHHALESFFDSPWGPPTIAYKALEGLGFRITAMYYEPGMGFAGRYEDGLDESMDVDDALNSWFGDELDSMFDIREQMKEWEEEEE